MIKILKDMRIEGSDEITVDLTIELEGITFNSYEDVNNWLEDVEDKYNDVLSQNDYIYLIDLAHTKFEEDDEEE